MTFSGYKAREDERAQEERKRPRTNKKKRGAEPEQEKPRKTKKRQHLEQKPEREHKPNKDYTERGIAFTIAFIPVDNKKTRKQAGGKRGRETGERRDS